MKIGIIGDIHGKTIWKDITLSNPDIELWIFLGDYVDSHFSVENEYLEANKEADNLNDIIEFAKANNSILLLGNHDIQYIDPSLYTCSGFSELKLSKFNKIFNNNIDLFNIAAEIKTSTKTYLITHAGVHKGWYKLYSKLRKLEDINISDFLNRLWFERNPCLFDIGKERGGNKKVGSPIWVDKSMIYEKALPKYHHIVGHNRVKDILEYKKKDFSITFCDCLDSRIDTKYSFCRL